ncbi:hypothetical protein ACPA9J_04245 [Pseudomonas aeruginosa]
MVAGGWSLLAKPAFAALFALFGHLFIDLQSDIAGVREVAYAYLPYLARLPLLEMWSYLLGRPAHHRRHPRPQMRNAMLLAVAASLPSAGCCRGWATTASGWRSSPSCCCAGWSGRLRLAPDRRDGWFAAQGADSGR